MLLAVPPILAVIFGVIAMRVSRESSVKSGQGMAIAGIIVGTLGIVAFALWYNSRQWVSSFLTGQAALRLAAGFAGI